MKKILLLAAAAYVAFGAFAQDTNNKVINGSFDKEGWSQSVPSGYTWDPWDKQNYLSELPGWTLATGGEWNGGIEMKTGDEALGDGDVRPEDDQNYVHLLGYNDNGWTPVSMKQAIDNLKAGTEYTLEFAIAVNWPEGTAWTPEPDYGFAFSEYDGDDENGAPKEGKEIVAVNLAKDGNYEPSQDFAVVTYKVTPTATKCVLRFYYKNEWGTSNKTDGKWMDLDCVKLYSDEDPDGNDTPAGINNVIADNAVVLGVYNLNGVRVADNVEGVSAKGLYIVRTANGAKKVVR